MKPVLFGSAVCRDRGFTLVELIIVLVLSSIIALMVGVAIRNPMQAFADTSRRASLTHMASMALARMESDILNAVPNSVRESGTVLELMPVSAAGRYRRGEVGDNAALSPAQSDGDFSLLGNLSSPASGTRMVVHPTSSDRLYAGAESGSAVITPAATSITVSDNVDDDSVHLSSSFRFDDIGNGSPDQRFYFTEGAVSYHCDTTAGNIRRYAGYDTRSAQPVSRSVLPLSAATRNALLVDHVSACSFSYQPGTPQRSSLVMLSLTLTDQGESVTLVRQIHVVNAP